MTTQITANIKQKEKSAQRLWIGFILVFFILQAILWTSAIRLTSNDLSHAIHPDYGQKALHWDQQVALQRASDQLQWTAQLSVAGSIESGVSPMLTLTITDDDNRPVLDATVELSAFDRARASERFSIQLNPTSPGVYTALLPATAPGRWQFQGTATQNDSVFIIDQQHSVGVK